MVCKCQSILRKLNHSWFVALSGQQSRRQRCCDMSLSPQSSGDVSMVKALASMKLQTDLERHTHFKLTIITAY